MSSRPLTSRSSRDQGTSRDAGGDGHYGPVMMFTRFESLVAIVAMVNAATVVLVGRCQFREKYLRLGRPVGDCA